MSQLTDGIKTLLERELDTEILDKFDSEGKDDKALDKYITFKAKKELNSKSGALPDEVVLGWARHFYLESKETIDKEMKVEKPKATPAEPKKTKEELEAERKAKEQRKAAAEAELVRLNKEDPFRVHTMDPNTFEITSEKPKNKVVKDENQMGLFDL